MGMSAPRICCLDLDTFFVSVERILDPSLNGKQVVVGGRPWTRGVVTSCSYEVREVPRIRNAPDTISMIGTVRPARLRGTSRVGVGAG